MQQNVTIKAAEDEAINKIVKKNYRCGIIIFLPLSLLQCGSSVFKKLMKNS